MWILVVDSIYPSGYRLRLDEILIFMADLAIFYALLPLSLPFPNLNLSYWIRKFQ